ncbi:acetyl-CoA C-acyltransferase [Luteococcus sp. Sow4_B9]|uniref:acetyl-CoA C-acyltransferase n=1 Tax=Luteococcus sp. Sow4_B9 TaxID=3438792 RepID=UPI003F9D6472
MKDVFVVAGARTAIGGFMGSLSKHTPVELGTQVASAALERAGVDPQVVDNAVFAQIVPTSGQDLYTSRMVSIGAGMRESTDAFNVNRLCGSGVQAIISGTQSILMDDAEISLVGGVEVMSRAPYMVEGMRAGRAMGDGVLQDWLTGTLSCPFEGYQMGVTAENVAEEYGITRERQDEFALQSQERAAAAIADGRFASQIVPIEVRKGRETIVFDTDEHPRATSLDKLAALKPVFKEGGTVTAGNSSGINDGAAAMVLASGAAVQQHGLAPMVRIVAWGMGGVAPSVMGMGPAVAVPKALAKAGLTLDDIDVVESNEAFAAQALAVQDALGLESTRTNIDGGAIALGHPVGATGAILTIKAVHRLREVGGKYALVTMCIGGGQGIALLLEAV